MKKISSKINILSFLIFYSSFLTSQTNLVPNPSFETYTACPSSSDISYAQGWLNFGQTPEYYNSCANISTPQAGIPSNYVGYQNAKDGNGYAGIVAFYPGNTREFIAIALSQTLSIGTKYFVSAYISRADTSPYICSCNRIGFRFSTIPFSFTTSVLINNFSHVNSSAIITDSLGWTKIAGSFVADSAYQYFIIGNFYDDINTSTSQCGHPLALAYYYVDQTCVSTDSMMCNVSTDIKYVGDINMAVYPNPAINNITIEIPFYLKNSLIKLFDIYGKEILTKPLDNTKTTIDISQIENGLFFLKLYYNNTYYNYKLLKQKL